MTEVNITPENSGRFGHVEDWTISLSSTPHAPDDERADVGSVSVVAEQTPTSALIQGDLITFTHVSSPDVNGRVTSVSGGSDIGFSFEVGTAFTKMVAERDVPAVGSGSPIAAVDLVQRIVHGRGLAYTGPGAGTELYWPLTGHSVCFDSDSEVVYGTNLDSAEVYVYLGGENPIYNVRRVPKTINNFSAVGYQQLGTEIYSTGGAGSSIIPAREVRYMIRYTTKFGPDDSLSRFKVAMGPHSLVDHTGKILTVEIDPNADTLGIDLDYVNGSGSDTSYSNTVSTASLDMTDELEVIIFIEYTGTNSFVVGASVEDEAAVSASLTPSAFTTGVDLYGYQYVLSGANFHDLVYVEAPSGTSIASFSAGMTFANMANYYEYPTLDNTGISAPFAGMTGTLWDYLKQVCGSRGVEMVIDGAKILIRDLREDVKVLKNTIGPVRREISDTGIASKVQFVNYGTSITKFDSDYSDIDIPVFSWDQIYDASDQDQNWQIGVNQTSTVTINVDHFPHIVMNPIPVSNIIVEEE